MRGNPDIAINCQGFSNIYFHKIVATVEGSFTLNIRIIYFKNFLNGFFCKYTLGEEEGIGEDCYFFLAHGNMFPRTLLWFAKTEKSS